jgi:DNA-binding IclR family transcriptional regulator
LAEQEVNKNTSVSYLWPLASLTSTSLRDRLDLQVSLRIMQSSPVKTAVRSSKPTPSIQSLDRGLVILETVAKSRRPVATAELADLLAIDHSSAFRLANTLKRRGFLACPGGRTDYVLGPAIWCLSRQYDWSNMLVRVCHEHLKRLAGEAGETAHLAVREGRQALFVDHVTSNHVILVSGQTGESVPLHCTAHGKALLADFEKPQLEALFGNTQLTTRAGNAIVSLDRLAEVCRLTKAQGYATDVEEFHEGIRCVAAPIRDKDGAIIASIGISALTARFPERRFPASGELASKVAREISDILGGEG